MPVPAAGMHMSPPMPPQCRVMRARGELANARNRQGAGAGLRIGVAVGRGGGADILGRGFC